MDIAICDDDCNALEAAKGLLRQISFVQFIQCFDDVNRLMTSLDHGDKYDVVIMDIDWAQKKTGIDYATQIYAKNKDIRVIFFTGYSDQYIEQVFINKMNLAGYLRKPLNLDYTAQILGKINREMIAESRERIFLKKKGNMVALNPKEITYIESLGHNIVVHSFDSEIRLYRSIGDFLKELPAQFVKCHKSFVINVDNVIAIEQGMAVFDDQLQVPISKKFYNEVKDFYFNRMSERL